MGEICGCFSEVVIFILLDCSGSGGEDLQGAIPGWLSVGMG